MSCAANAKNNLEMSKSKLYISEAFADQGPYLKRMQPRAKGRAYLILKPTCSITIKMMSHECVFGRLPSAAQPHARSACQVEQARTTAHQAVSPLSVSVWRRWAAR